MEQNSKKLKKIIIVLAILLGITSVALAGVLISKNLNGNGKDPTTVEIKDNIITPEGDEKPNKKPETNDKNDIKKEESNNNSDTQSNSETGSTDVSDVSNISNNDSSTSAIDEVKEADVLSLYSNHPNDNQPFHVTNMFPGDEVTKYYCINVSHKDDITVHYRANIRKGYEKLAEVLKVRITLLNENKMMYDGLMKDMPKSLKHTLHTDKSTESKLYYEIDVYLDTSVGNEYMNKKLIADFKWWVEGEDQQALDTPQTGDMTNIYMWIGLAMVSFFVLIIVLKKNKKEEGDEQ